MLRQQTRRAERVSGQIEKIVGGSEQETLHLVLTLRPMEFDEPLWAFVAEKFLSATQDHGLCAFDVHLHEIRFAEARGR